MLRELALKNGINPEPVSLGLIGVNHHTTSVSEREAFSNVHKLYDAFQELDAEHAVISTCNRTELVFGSSKSNFEKLQDTVFDRFSSFLPTNSRKSDSLIYKYYNNDAVGHFFKVAAGLDSMVLGEAEILGQMKKAYKDAIGFGKVKFILHKLFQSAFHTAKEVRSNTGVGRGKISVASTAVSATKNIYGDLTQLKVLIIGAGETASLLSQHFRTSGVSQFFISNRTQSNAKNLVEELNGIFIPLDKIPMVLTNVDVVAVAINNPNAKEYLITKDQVKSLLKNNFRKTFCYLDLSVPQVIDPGITDLSSVYLFNLDSLGEVARQNQQIRESEAERAKIIIDNQVSEFNKWKDSRVRHKLIESLFSHFLTITSEENNRIAKQIISIKNNQLIENEVVDTLEKSFDSVSRKLFDPLLRAFKEGEITDEEMKVFLKCLGVFKNF